MTTILICYDGSPDAEAAIDAAGGLFTGRSAVVLTIWEGFTGVITRAGAGMAIASLDFDEIDRASRDIAAERAQEGCGRARAAGLDAQPLVAERDITIWETILDQAARHDAELIVLGTRGLTGLKSLLLGSVSHAVLQHADRPVIVVPAAEVARRRARRALSSAEGNDRLSDDGSSDTRSSEGRPERHGAARPGGGAAPGARGGT